VLAEVAGGLTSLWCGKPVWDHLAPALKPAADVLPSGVRSIVPSSWRIYTPIGKSVRPTGTATKL
jgi:hypothetical protein